MEMRSFLIEYRIMWNRCEVHSASTVFNLLVLQNLHFMEF